MGQILGEGNVGVGVGELDGHKGTLGPCKDIVKEGRENIHNTAEGHMDRDTLDTAVELQDSGKLLHLKSVFQVVHQ